MYPRIHPHNIPFPRDQIYFPGRSELQRGHLSSVSMWTSSGHPHSHQFSIHADQSDQSCNRQLYYMVTLDLAFFQSFWWPIRGLEKSYVTSKGNKVIRNIKGKYLAFLVLAPQTDLQLEQLEVNHGQQWRNALSLSSSLMGSSTASWERSSSIFSKRYFML